MRVRMKRNMTGTVLGQVDNRPVMSVVIGDVLDTSDEMGEKLIAQDRAERINDAATRQATPQDNDSEAE